MSLGLSRLATRMSLPPPPRDRGDVHRRCPGLNRAPALPEQRLGGHACGPRCRRLPTSPDASVALNWKCPAPLEPAIRYVCRVSRTSMSLLKPTPHGDPVLPVSADGSARVTSVMDICRMSSCRTWDIRRNVPVTAQDMRLPPRASFSLSLGLSFCLSSWVSQCMSIWVSSDTSRFSSRFDARGLSLAAAGSVSFSSSHSVAYFLSGYVSPKVLRESADGMSHNVSQSLLQRFFRELFGVSFGGLSCGLSGDSGRGTARRFLSDTARGMLRLSVRGPFRSSLRELSRGTWGEPVRDLSHRPAAGLSRWPVREVRRVAARGWLRSVVRRTLRAPFRGFAPATARRGGRQTARGVSCAVFCGAITRPPRGARGGTGRHPGP